MKRNTILFLSENIKSTYPESRWFLIKSANRINNKNNTQILYGRK